MSIQRADHVQNIFWAETRIWQILNSRFGCGSMKADFGYVKRADFRRKNIFPQSLDERDHKLHRRPLLATTVEL